MIKLRHKLQKNYPINLRIDRIMKQKDNAKALNF